MHSRRKKTRASENELQALGVTTPGKCDTFTDEGALRPKVRMQSHADAPYTVLDERIISSDGACQSTT